MNRNIMLLVIIFLAFPLVVYSAKTFVIQETEKISLEPSVTDPDNDLLSITYSPPLDENGEWQTTYGDKGEYRITITASDGMLSASEEVLLIVNKKEEPPVIISYSPLELLLTITELDEVDFSVTASDLNNDPLAYWWYVDGVKARDGQEFSYKSNYNDEGPHKVRAVVSDGVSEASMEWALNVRDFDIQKLLDDIPDVAINENEVASLELPDFDKYGLAYSISDPIGTDNEWKTGYDDAGAYDVDVYAEGNGFEGSAEVRLTVNDVDRPPVFEPIGNKVINENQLLTIALEADDPDGDEITYSANSLPEGAELQGNMFTWQPGFDTIVKEGFIDYTVGKFTVLTKNFYVQFVASSKEKSVVYNMVITVKDVNRPPVLEDMAPITINEGETLNIAPKAYDPDNDKISIKYSGLTATGTYDSDFDDAGVYTVTVTASDGALSASKNVLITINPTNRMPVFSQIQDTETEEGNAVVILLDAYDPDYDNLTFSVQNPPEDSSLNGNVFTWTPHFGTVSGKGAKTFEFVFAASDGRATARQTGKVEVSNRNRVPRITNFSTNLVVEVNEPVLMFIKAVDDDGDPLTYTWDFGLLEKYEATESHQRIFTTSGAKSIKVVVSDGIDSAEQTINVLVKGEPKALLPAANRSVSTTTQKVNITYRKETKINKIYKVTGPKDVVDIVKKKVGVQTKNRLPRITSFSNNVVAEANQPVLLFVKAVDDDGDALTYTWDFGLSGKFSGGPTHQRTFTTTGKKSVKVTVSDGRNSVMVNMNVDVV